MPNNCRTAVPEFHDDPAMEVEDRRPQPVRVPCGWCSTTGRTRDYGSVYRDAWNRCVKCAGLGYIVQEAP